MVGRLGGRERAIHARSAYPGGVGTCSSARRSCAPRAPAAHPPELPAYSASVTDPPIRTARLELPALTVAQYDRLMAGDREAVGRELHAEIGEAWLADAAWLIGLRRRQIEEHPDHRPWLIRPIIRREPDAAREVIGYVNFHAPPDDQGIAEIGYALLPAWRGRGYAIEAVAGALAWALEDPRVRTLRASVAPDNDASRRLVARLGFVQTGEQWDPEDGLELVHDIDRDAFAARVTAG